MSQFINLVINGSVLFNVSVGLGNVCFRLVVIIIGNKIFHSVFREEGFKLTGELRRQSLIVGDNKGWLLNLVYYLGNGIGFACTCCAQKNLSSQTLLYSLRQLLDCLGLIPCRFKGCLNFKIHFAHHVTNYKSITILTGQWSLPKISV